MKKSIKLTIFILIILLATTVCSSCYAEDLLGTGKLDTNQFELSEIPSNNVITNKAKTLVSVIRVAGVAVAIVGIMAIGIKYLLGSVEERADYKKTLIPYLIGCIMIFAITEIVSIIYNLVSQVEV